MVRGRPKGDEATCVLAVRVPIALRAALDRSRDALETRSGLKASRNEIIRHAVRRFLEALHIPRESWLMVTFSDVMRNGQNQAA